MLRRRALFVTVTGMLGILAVSPCEAETVQDAVNAALASHPAIDIAGAQRAIAEAGESEEYSNLFPELTASATGGRMFGDNATSRGLTVSRGEAYSWLWEGNAAITQPIFNGFETYNRIDAAKARQGAAEFTLADAQQAIALKAVQAFFNVMRAQEAYARSASYKDRIADYVSRIDAMVAEGAGDETESAQAKNIQAQLDNTVAEMDGQVKLAMADYAEATGSVPSGELVRSDSAQSALFQTVDDAVSYAQANHPLMLSARKAMEAEDEEVSAERGTLLPDLDAEASYLKRDQKEEIGGELIDGRAVMRLSWGFSTGGGQLARIRKAKAERSEAMARTAQTQREIERDIRRAFAEYETAQKQKELNARRETVTKDLFATYQKQFEASKVRLLQLMQAENQLFTTELERINADYRVMIAEYTTLASAGRLLAAIQTPAADKQSPAAGEQASDQSPVAATEMPKSAGAETAIYSAEDSALGSDDKSRPAM